MKETNSQYFHKLYGEKVQRITYQSKDFVDYVLMAIVTAFIIGFSYGIDNIVSIIGLMLCGFAIIAFVIRHGWHIKMPVILQRPQEILYMFIHKIQNIRTMYFVAIGLLAIENLVIYLTPNLPHNVELTHKIAVYAFYLHFAFITIYRTMIFIAHLHKKAMVEEILMQTVWKTTLSGKSNVTLEIVHAYFTGLLTHIVFLVPWYLVIMNFNYSIILFPVTMLLNVFIQIYFVKVLNSWFYRDHWLGHNSEFEFVYLHGPHHDAIPSGLIGVAGNGYLEGFFRSLLAYPIPFYNPIMAAFYYTFDVKIDIESHQYIPGIFPKSTRELQEVTQHSTHHYGRIEPYSFAIKLDLPDISEDTKNKFKLFPDELKYSVRIDEELTGFKWDNPRHKRFLDLFDKYQK